MSDSAAEHGSQPNHPAETDVLESSQSRLSDLAWWCVLAIAGIGPLLTTNLTAFGMKYPLTYDQNMLLRAVLTAVASFAAIGFASLGDKRGLFSSPHRWSLMAFIALTFTSVGFTEWKGIGIFGDYAHYEGALMFLAYVSLAAAVTQTVSPARLRSLARVITAVGGLLSFYGYLQILGLDPSRYLSATFTLTRSFATWGNPDFFGMYLVLPLTFSAAVALSDPNVWWRRIAAAAFALEVLALIGTVTRGAWLAGIVALAVLAFALTRAGRRPLRWQSFALAALAVAAFLAAHGGHRIVNRVSTLSSAGSDSGVGSRFDIWRQALYVASRNPLFGGGPDALGQNMSRYYAVGSVNDAHNWFLQLAATVGFPAAIVLFGFFAWVLASTVRRVWKPGTDADSALRAACWAASAGTIVALLLGLSQTVSTAMLFVCLGVLLRDCAQLFVAPKGNMAGSGVLMLVLALVAVGFGVRGIAADAEMMQARAIAHDRPKDVASRLAHAERAVELNPLYARYQEELAQAKAAAK